MGRPADSDETVPAEDEPTPAFVLLFRAWIALVLLVLCISLLQYLLLKLHR